MKKNIRLEDLNSAEFKTPSDNLDAVAHLGVAAALDGISTTIFQLQAELEEIKQLVGAVGPAVSAYGEAANNKLDALLAASANKEEETHTPKKESNLQRAKRIAGEVKEAMRKRRMDALQKKLDKLQQEGGAK